MSSSAGYPTLSSEPFLDGNVNSSYNKNQQPVNLGWFKWFQVLSSIVIIALGALNYSQLKSVSSDVSDSKSTLNNVNSLIAGAASGKTAQNATVGPLNFVASNVPPRTYQLTRGTCWDFGTIGAVEHQYRLQGINNGWLSPNQYLRLSEQAYGNQVVKLCQSYQQRCLLPGDHVAFNSTEGGEAVLLFSFQNELARSILPSSVCPYISIPGPHESDCPNIDAALASNPVSFKLKSYSTLYSVDSIKKAIVSRGYSMPLSFPIHTVSFYLPCTDPHVSSSNTCKLDTLYTPCPTDAQGSFGGSDRCVKYSAPMYNMNGEFRMHHALDAEAGHVVLLVGYSDTYVTKDGTKGGFIVRNSWKDGLYSFDEFKNMISRGSHSLLYFTQQISEADERKLCPNSYYPDNWYTCGGGGGGNPNDMMSDCFARYNQITAKALYQPLNLQCATNNGTVINQYCGVDVNRYRFFLLNTTNYRDSFTVACFLKADMTFNNATDLCLPPMPIDNIATIFTPMTSDIIANNDDYCGYYFYPYSVYELGQITFDSAFVNDYEISFDASSYQANAAQYAQYKYDLLTQSTLTQQPLPTFPNAFPLSQ